MSDEPCKFFTYAELHRLDLEIEYLDSSPNNNHQGDMSYCGPWQPCWQGLLYSQNGCRHNMPEPGQNLPIAFNIGPIRS